MSKKIAILLLSTMLLTIFSACNKQQTDINSSIDEITKDVKFLNLNENPKYKECAEDKDSKAIIRIGIFRKRDVGCEGWGVCYVYILCWQVYKDINEESTEPSREIAAPIVREGTEDYLYLYLSEDASSIPTASLALQLEESKIDTDDYGTIIIPQDIYPFSPTLGQYGGYRIKVIVIKH